MDDVDDQCNNLSKTRVTVTITAASLSSISLANSLPKLSWWNCMYWLREYTQSSAESHFMLPSSTWPRHSTLWAEMAFSRSWPRLVFFLLYSVSWNSFMMTWKEQSCTIAPLPTHWHPQWSEARLCPCPYTVQNLFCHTPKTCFWRSHRRNLNQVRW